MEKRPIISFVRKNLLEAELETFASEVKDQIVNMLHMGWGNGYALIPPGHPLFGQESIDISVHGNITLYGYAKDVEWPEIPESYKDSWIVGFDTCHYWDTPAHDENYVRGKAKELAEILESMW